jgi:propanol-preferring alcohol dehydrogenase
MPEQYRAVQATAPGQLVPTTLPVEDPPPGHVRIRVEACGVCHSDAATVEGVLPIEFPRVPGHEVVGRIDAVGVGVEAWRKGDRVGVGFLGGQCNHCAQCRRGDFVNCENQALTGVHVDGGYAEMLIAKATGLIAVPSELDSIEAAPLLCAGLTTFNALRNAPARPGDLVAIGGLGGLGHLAVQYARQMGFHVVAIARGPEKGDLAKQFGAHEYIDSLATDPAEALTALGGATVILGTAADSEANARLVPGLAPRGTLIVVGVGEEPLAIAGPDLLFGSRGLAGVMTGSSADGEDTLNFSALQDVRAQIEVRGLSEAPQAYSRMLANEARFRIVLDATR